MNKLPFLKKLGLLVGFIFIPYLIGYIASLFLGDLAHIIGSFFVIVYWTFGIGVLAALYGIANMVRDLFKKGG